MPSCHRSKLCHKVKQLLDQAERSQSKASDFSNHHKSLVHPQRNCHSLHLLLLDFRAHCHSFGDQSLFSVPGQAEKQLLLHQAWAAFGFRWRCEAQDLRNPYGFSNQRVPQNKHPRLQEQALSHSCQAKLYGQRIDGQLEKAWED